MIDKFKKDLTNNNLKFEEITDEVLLIKDFLTKEELEFIWKIINSVSQSRYQSAPIVICVDTALR